MADTHDWRDALEQERDNLKAVNAALVDALEEMMAAHRRVDPHDLDSCSNCMRARAALNMALAKDEEPGSGHPKWHEERQRGERCEHLRRYEDDCRECGRTCQKPCGWLFADGTRCQRPGDGHRHAGPVWWTP